MNILLVYPEYPDTFWSFKHALKFIKRNAAFPPLGLLTVAAMLPKNWNKWLIDVNVRSLNDDAIRWADMIFLSAMLVQKNNAQEIINRCKKHGKTVVVGGPAFTSSSEKFQNIDHYVLGEAEANLPNFLEDLKNDSLKPIYDSKEFLPLKNTPIPMWSLIHLKDYATISVQHSRGCPFNCEFCSVITMNGRVPRVKGIRQMLLEFQALFDVGWRGPVFVVDDNFIGNKAKVKKMLPLLIDWQEANSHPFNFFTEASVDLALNDELIQLMVRAGFNKVFLGIETPNEDSLKECHKTQNINLSLPDAVKTLHGYGLQVMGGFIVGFDNDKEDIFSAQIRFIQNVGIPTAMVGMLNAIPGTPLWTRLKAENRIRSDSTGENTDGSLNFIPIMGVEKLIAGYERIISTLYESKTYYARIKRFLEDYNPTAQKRLSLNDFNAFIRSIWQIGLFSKSFHRYWKLLIVTFFTKKRALPVAIELMIVGQHFMKIAKRTTDQKYHPC